MRTLTLLLLLLVLGSANKCNDKKGAGALVQQLGNGMWALETLNGQAIGLPEGVERPWLKLVPEESRVEGHGGCNSLFGGYELEGSTLRFPGLASTKKFCEGVQGLETGFMQALNATDGFKLDGGLLTLQQGGKALATLKRLEP
jgi:putative lipoprotein